MTNPQNPESESPKRRVHPIVRDFLSMAGSRYFSIAAGILRSILIPKFLNPGAYGVLKSYQMFLELSRIAALGIPSAIARELPIALKRKETARRDALLNNGYWATLLSAAPLGIVILIGGVTGWIRFEEVEIEWWFVLFIPLLLIDRSKLFLTLVLMGQKQFVFWSKIRLLDELLTTSICVLAAYRFGFKGLLSAMLLVNLTVVILCWSGSMFRLRRKIDLSVAREMISIGFPHLLNGLGHTIYTQLNRMVILAVYGVASVGFFSVGTTIAEQVVGMARVMGRVLLPRMMEASGASENPEEIRRYFFIPIRLTSMLFAPIVAVGSILLEIIFVLLLPQYSEGYLPARILLVGVFFLAIWSSVSPFFLAVKKQWRLTMIFLVTIPVALVLNLTVVSMGLDLPGIALATALSNFGFVTTALLVAMKEFYSFNGRRILEVMKVYSPLPVAAAAVIAGEWIREVSGLSGSHLWGPIVSSIAVSVLYGAPMALLILTGRGRRIIGLPNLRQ